VKVDEVKKQHRVPLSLLSFASTPVFLGLPSSGGLEKSGMSTTVIPVCTAVITAERKPENTISIALPGSIRGPTTP